MADDILDFLRERFNRLDAANAEMRAEIRELTTRVGRLERLTADLHGDFAMLSARIDRCAGSWSPLQSANPQTGFER